QISKAVREICIFARQNLTADPPFSKVDLISCRNLLIYLEPTLQKKVLPLFHYALKPAGFLMLGTSETLGSQAELFTTEDKQFRIFRKAEIAKPPPVEFGQEMFDDHSARAATHEAHSQQDKGWTLQDALKLADGIIL